MIFKILKTIFFITIMRLNAWTYAISDIKPIKGADGIFHEFMYYQIFIILLLILLYLYNIKINKKEDQLTLSEQCIIKNYNMKVKFLIKNLRILLKSADVLDKTEFYEKLNKIFREYFNLLWVEYADIMTLKEIKGLDLDKDLILLFEKSYLNEFNAKKDTTLWRKNLINKFIKSIK